MTEKKLPSSTRKKKHSEGNARDINLNVLPMDDHTPKGSTIRKSKNSTKRAIVLGIIQILMIFHVGLWLLSQKYGWFDGRTLSPIEPSESMQTIEKGFINAGAVFFGLALISTLIFGRFVCGWACHLIMLQDICSWIMKKLGIRPKPFKSRILVYVPLIVALYMFVWPAFKRLALFPLIITNWPEALVYFNPVPGWQGFSNHLVSEYYWSNPEAGIAFPLVMAVPTLLICGFAIVYFLGSKGFCTYGCPYGGFFAPLDELSPGRIRVTTDCDQSGHCTATCSSNVRVHEEVREYGMVVDSGCMKCLDCVSVCPNNALYFGFGTPAFKKPEPKKSHPKKRYDLSAGEDIAIGVLFLLVFLAVRGLYLWEGVPLLMTIGISGVVSFLLFKCWRLFSSSSDRVSIQSLKLKSKGRITKTGWGFALLTFVLLGLTIENGLINWHGWRAEIIARTDALVSRETALSPFNKDGISQETRNAAGEAISHLENTLSVSEGGMAWMTKPSIYLNISWMHVVEGDFNKAEKRLLQFVDIKGTADALCTDLILMKLLQGKEEEAIQYARDLTITNPEYQSVQSLLTSMQSDPRLPVSGGN